MASPKSLSQLCRYENCYNGVSEISEMGYCYTHETMCKNIKLHCDNQRLNEQIKQVAEKITDLKNSIGEKDKENASLRDLIDKKDKEIASLREQLVLREDYIKEFETNMNNIMKRGNEIKRRKI